MGSAAERERPRGLGVMVCDRDAMGVGAEGASLRGPAVRRIAFAWVGTLPVAAVLGATLASWLA